VASARARARTHARTHTHTHTHTHTFFPNRSFQSRYLYVFFSQNAQLFHIQRNIRTTVSRTMKLHFRKSNRGPDASSQLHCLYECANNGTTHFLREYILTISNRSRTCRQANTQILRICTDPLIENLQIRDFYQFNAFMRIEIS